jgi:methionyl-tRNA synthetase
MSQTIHIIAPPPTPNGDLHIGHMSGPYLGADLFARTVRQQGLRPNFVVSTDDHQSYVDTTARRLGTTAQALIAKSRAEIGASFDRYGIQLSAFGVIDDRYHQFVQNFVLQLFRRELLKVQEVNVLFDNQLGCYAVEAFVSGLCRHCLASSAGGICEACGQPNTCTDLLGLDAARFSQRREPRLVLDLERFRAGLEQHLGAMHTHRPWLRRLIDSLLAKPLAPFIMSYKAQRGISLGFVGLPDQHLNVWGEMFPGHIYFLSQAAGSISRNDRYVQFLGFDNSYFYVFVHLALSLAADEAGFNWPAPQAFITNQFYNLGNEKFSTSKGHLVWARDLAVDFDTDVIRLFLALHGPEYQEADFSMAAFATEANRLERDINAVVSHYNSCSYTVADAGAVSALVTAMRPECAIERYSASDNARRVLNGIRALVQVPMVEQGGLIAYIPSLLALALDPFCPRYAAAIRARFGFTSVSWDSLVPVEAGIALPEFLAPNAPKGSRP